jgi:hypothetical protein
VTIGAFQEITQAERFALSPARLPRPSKEGSPPLFLAYSPTSSRFFEQNETLASLPLLIWELSGGCIEEMVVVDDRFGILMQRIVGCSPKKVG